MNYTTKKNTHSPRQQATSYEPLHMQDIKTVTSEIRVSGMLVQSPWSITRSHEHGVEVCVSHSPPR